MTYTSDRCRAMRNASRAEMKSYHSALNGYSGGGRFNSCALKHNTSTQLERCVYACVCVCAPANKIQPQQKRGRFHITTENNTAPAQCTSINVRGQQAQQSKNEPAHAQHQQSSFGHRCQSEQCTLTRHVAALAPRPAPRASRTTNRLRDIII